MSRETATSTVRALIDLIQTRELPFLAAAIAYYAFLSVVPLLIVGVTVATALAGQTLATEVIDALDAFLTPEAATLIEETIVDSSGRGGMTAVGLLVLLWSGLRVFRGLDIAFSRVYGRGEPKSLLWQLRDAVLVFGAIVLAIGVTVVLGTLVSVTDLPLAGTGSTIGLLVVLVFVFLPLYYVFPTQGVALREALPGAMFASGGWTALGAGFGIYAANAGSFQLYGVLGGVLLLLVWFYFGGLILLVGVAINVVLGTRSEDRQLQQAGQREKSQRASMTDAAGPSDADDGDDSRGSDTDSRDDRNGDEYARAESTESASPTADGDDSTVAEASEQIPTGREDPDVSARITQEDIDDLRRELDEIETRLEERTVHRKELEDDLKKYVRSKIRRGHATGWGPYMVLLYGTAMTLGAFFFLDGIWAILAMFVIWLSTLGLYTVMLLVGMTANGLRLPGKVLDVIRGLR